MPTTISAPTKPSDEHFAVLKLQEATEASSDHLQRLSMARLLDGYADARKSWAKIQERTADDFNILEVAAIASDEKRHSKMLAWLLDRDLEVYGTHAQGVLGFRLFLDELGWPAKYADKPYTVQLERSHDESRVDIEISARRHFLIHIENKIHSPEGPQQTTREARDLVRKAEALQVPNGNARGIFLTLDGRAPSGGPFTSISWSLIARVLQRFAEEAQPSDVKLFSRHYSAALRKFTAAQPETEISTI
jgi:PD-(D/E)XK nuclease superfamily